MRPGQERQPDVMVEHACDLVELALEGAVRRAILERAMGSGGFVRGLRRLRLAMRSHRFETTSEPIVLERAVEELDRRTRLEGFHVLQAWDYAQQRFSEDNVGVLMLDHCLASGFLQREEPVALAILLDYYFLHVLALCVMRAWDAPDPGAVFDRVTELLGRLQGAGGSGQRFVDDAETLLMLAVSHFHPEETAYDRLIEQVRTLDNGHRTRFALVSSAVLGSHLRWGSTVMYKRDLVRMRGDNVGDYPWLLFSLATLMRTYATMCDEGVHGAERRNLVAGLLNGLTADPWAFIGQPPTALRQHQAEHADLRALLGQRGSDLLAEIEAHRPSDEGYSPLAFHFNFPNNALVATVTVALLQGTPQKLPLNALLVCEHGDERDVAVDLRGIVAKTLMYYSASSPDRLGQSGEMLIVYDPQVGLRHYNQVLGALRKHVAGASRG